VFYPITTFFASLVSDVQLHHISIKRLSYNREIWFEMFRDIFHVYRIARQYNSFSSIMQYPLTFDMPPISRVLCKPKSRTTKNFCQFFTTIVSLI
jgi:hypothetical protein